MATPAPFKRMLEPLSLGFTTLQNRVVMGSMHTGLEEAKDDPFGRMARFFRERAEGGVGLIVTGGIAPNHEGKVHPLAGKMSKRAEAAHYKPVTDAVHQAGGKILMQILHSGRYAYSPLAVAPSSVASPLWKFSPLRPIGLPQFWIRKTIQDFANCAVLAREAGFDGVEIMGSEGYLLNEFLVTHTNKRTDEYGGSYENRMRFPLEVLRQTRAAVGKDFIIMFRCSLLDLIPNGSTQDEAHAFAEQVALSGADIINTGIGWHEARIPTIATSVPRAAFTYCTKRCRDHLRGKGINTPLVTTNRINTPEVIESILEKGEADMVSMARPFLADSHFVQKAAAGRPKEINICIGCNQACLDHTFSMRTSSCLVNPVACHETLLTPKVVEPTQAKRVLVVGAGPAGCSCAITAASIGHHVTLIEASEKLGGQFHIAKRIPGKAEFQSTIDYWNHMILEKHAQRINVQLNTKFDSEQHLPRDHNFDELVIACGSIPRSISDKVIPGLKNSPIAISYRDAVLGIRPIGKRVAVIGAGGIGFDVAVMLTHPNSETFEAFAKEWGIDVSPTPSRGALATPVVSSAVVGREVFMFQRKSGKMGKGLGVTTGWIHRAAVQKHNVKQFTGTTYDRLEGQTLHFTQEGQKKQLENLDSIVMCHGQESQDALVAAIKPVIENTRCRLQVIGGSRLAAELDAKRAVREGHEAAMKF